MLTNFNLTEADKELTFEAGKVYRSWHSKTKRYHHSPTEESTVIKLDLNIIM